MWQCDRCQSFEALASYGFGANRPCIVGIHSINIFSPPGTSKLGIDVAANGLSSQPSKVCWQNPYIVSRSGERNGFASASQNPVAMFWRQTVERVTIRGLLISRNFLGSIPQFCSTGRSSHRGPSLVVSVVANEACSCPAVLWCASLPPSPFECRLVSQKPFASTMGSAALFTLVAAHTGLPQYLVANFQVAPLGFSPLEGTVLGIPFFCSRQTSLIIWDLQMDCVRSSRWGAARCHFVAGWASSPHRQLQGQEVSPIAVTWARRSSRLLPMLGGHSAARGVLIFPGMCITCAVVQMVERVLQKLAGRRSSHVRG